MKKIDFEKTNTENCSNCYPKNPHDCPYFLIETGDGGFANIRYNGIACKGWREENHET